MKIHLKDQNQLIFKSLALIIVLIGILFTAHKIQAAVFNLPQKVLQSAFKDATINIDNVFINNQLAAQVAEQFQSKLDSRMLSIYKAKNKKGQTSGFGLFITHTVRTNKQTFFMHLDKSLAIQHIEVLSFYEPLDYLSPDRWIELFYGLNDPQKMNINQQIPNISGATLTCRSMNLEIKKHLFVAKKLLH